MMKFKLAILIIALSLFGMIVIPDTMAAEQSRTALQTQILSNKLITYNTQKTFDTLTNINDSAFNKTTDAITDIGTITATDAEINLLDSSAISFSSSNVGLVRFTTDNMALSEINAGHVLLSGVTGLKYYNVRASIIPDAAIAACTSIIIEDSAAGVSDDPASTFTIPAGYDGGAVLFSSSGISYTSSSFNGFVAGGDVTIDNVGSSCTGPTNVRINVEAILAP